MRNKYVTKTAAILLAMTVPVLLAGCVDQSQGQKNPGNQIGAESQDTLNTDTKTLLEINDPEEKAAVEAAKKKVAAMDEEPRIIATSPATAQICDKLELDLVGVCSSSISTIPERYKDAATVGGAMSPDMTLFRSGNSVQSSQ